MVRKMIDLLNIALQCLKTNMDTENDGFGKGGAF